MQSSLAGVLPDVDPAIDALPDELRTAVAERWRDRARAELATAAAFAAAAHVVLSRPGPAELHWLVARAVSDEVRHSALCAEVARRYAPGASHSPIPPAPARAGIWAGGEDGTTLFVVAQCCIEESIGASWLAASHAVSAAATARAATRALLADDVEHGRAGWAFAAMLDEPERKRARAALPAVLARSRARWLARASAVTFALPAHGILAADEVMAAVDDAITRLVRPGLAELDLL